ncbi:hypothetical protein QYH60_13285 (plasmid) [Lactococcus lactis subsp. lactis]|uniref:hypothetical protein n=1 Tax=Lactococcus lactis TaxID=1358 RepID=UPI002649F013|nr:hypothetical protein [Lactococcus lactis]WKB49921.1 hypothetical protein QYH60_13285 [Lactococcus lactis subsp. lactis]
MKKMYITTCAASLLIFGGVATQVFADNHGDTSWHNEYRIWSPDDHTPARTKTNTTSMYNLTNRLSGGEYQTVWAALADGTDAAAGGHRQNSHVGVPNFLWNNAVENHGSGVSVRVNFQAWINGDADGVWSPDSV